MAAIWRCRHADVIDVPVTCFVTDDLKEVELCDDCAVMLLESLIAHMTFDKLKTAINRADEKS